MIFILFCTILTLRRNISISVLLTIGMTWYLLGLLFFMVIRWMFATPYQSEIERYEDKHNWTSLGGC